jgi:hypothetical protein
LDFAEMAADEVGNLLLGKIAAVLGNKDYIVFLD